MKRVVFAGPSIFGIDLSHYPQIEVRPPAACGDILSCTSEGVDAIGLIDGVYADCVAVWHKEILYALSRNIRILGAASMGALRAAECMPFGMIGIGTIFETYRDGSRRSDADVALVHAPSDLGFRPLTIALVDAEATLDSLIGLVCADDIIKLRDAARRLHFSKRTWRSITEAACVSPSLHILLREQAMSAKRCDALKLLDHMRDMPPADTQAKATWSFQDTLFFRELQHTLDRQQAGP